MHRHVLQCANAKQTAPELRPVPMHTALFGVDLRSLLVI